MEIFARLDRDGIAKLFVIEGGKPILITHQRWLDITKELQLQPGEMPLVILAKQGELTKPHTS